MPETSIATRWKVGPQRELALAEPVLMGVLNVTPDSFSDGGRFAAPEDAVREAQQLIADGAGIIDVGGESTRPGAQRVDPAEQMRRTLPVIEALRAHDPDVLISIDTTRADVAEAALRAGANVINDVSAGREDARLPAVAAEHACGLILMHRLVPPDRDSYSHEYRRPPAYGDVVDEVRRFLLERAEAVAALGVAGEAIVIDPGLGFGKTVEQNYALIARTAELAAAGYPVLGAASRKSFVGAVSGEPTPARREPGSIAVSVVQYLAGVRLFRVHDVAAHRQALAVTRAVRAASEACLRVPGAVLPYPPSGPRP